MINKNNFKEDLAKENIILTDQMLEQFDLYFKLLEKYNKVMDLTNVIDEDEVYDRHFYNSLTIAFDFDFNNLHLCDVGAGAGFPSIPLKICFPNMKLTIIDPLSKRMDFLKIVIEQLNLQDVDILYLRAEDASLKYQEQFDVVSARAVAPLNILVEITSQLVKVNGYLITMKGKKAQDELDVSKNAIETCKLHLEKQVTVGESTNLYFKKMAKISNKYPRNYGQIKRRPL